MKSAPIGVLLVDDDEDDYRRVAERFSEMGEDRFALEWAPDFASGLTALGSGRHRVCLLDHHLGARTGLTLLKEALAAGCTVPVIVLTDPGDRALEQAALAAGAADYLDKSQLDVDRIARAIRHALERHRVQESLRKRDREFLAETQALRARLSAADRMVSVGTLAAGVAHEINNPLAAIIANVEAAARAVKGLAEHPHLPGLDAVEASLADTLDAARRVKQIVSDLKRFSRPDEELKDAVDVRKALDATLRMVWNEVRHRAQLVKDYGEVPTIDVNESRLVQVFLNLLVNAAQAIPEGHASEHRIRLVTRTEAGRVVVEVSDTGSGIPPERLERIFEPFFTTKPVGQGTGLGLSIVHGIVQSFSGEISVESRVGQGTTFKVSLPAGTLRLTPPPARTPVPIAPQRRARVLVVDDEPVILRAVARTLVAHDVVTVEEGTAALRLLESGQRFDVILCDLMMPEMSGMDLHAAIARFAPDVAQKMVFLTGGAFAENAQLFLDQPGRLRLDKPFEPRTLRRLVEGAAG